MRKVGLFLLALAFSTISSEVSAAISIRVKIAQVIGTQTIETVKTISTNYNQDIVIVPEGLKNNIVLNLKKFKNILVNGNKINPVQIDMKLVNGMKKIVGKPQTVTSFYNQSAQFNVASNGQLTPDSADINVSLNFEEIN